MKEPFLSAIPVLKQLEDAGYEAYFVGGSVRDYLLGRKISDVDIATSATPMEVKGIFRKTVDIGIEHGTVLVLFDGAAYEITTFRSEAEYEDFRRPKEVAFIRNLREDLQRRDFTMNAIAMDLNGKLIDPFDGQSAIRGKVICTVGQAEERFHEDALRMMRAVRFVSQLSFTVESETFKALKNLTPLLEHIAVERKRVEFEKLLVGMNRKNSLKLLIETEIFRYLPSMAASKESLVRLLDFECSHLMTKEMWALLIYCLNLKEKAIEQFLRDWRLPLKEIREIQSVLHFTRKRLEQEWSLRDLYLAGREAILSAERLSVVLVNGKEDNRSVSYWLNKYEKLPIKGRSEMNVTGNDIMTWLDKSGGPWLKETLEEVEQAILEGRIPNHKQKIKEWLVKCSQK